ncbi:MAG: hypothetical protein ABFR82_05875 [Nitrospirota bacterium]
MSEAYLCIEKDGISAFPNIGFGPDSNKSTKLFVEAISALKNTVGSQLNESLALLKNVYAECSETNWDGYDAPPISPNAYWETMSFIRLLPSWIPKPDILGGTDGEIILEWYKNSSRLFAISITGKNELIYAGLFGPYSRNGSTYFGNSIPEEIINYIQKIN